MLTRAATWFGLFWGPPPLEELSVDLLTGHWTPSATSKTLDGRLQSANSRIVRRLKLAVMKNSRRLQLIHTGTSVRFICALETSESPSSSPQACICGPVNPSKDRQFRLWLWSGQSPNGACQVAFARGLRFAAPGKAGDFCCLGIFCSSIMSSPRAVPYIRHFSSTRARKQRQRS